MPIDYAALAAQHGGSDAPPKPSVDYASLASNFQTPQPKSFGQKVGGFFKGVGNALTGSEQTLGKGLSLAGEVFNPGHATSATVGNINSQDLQHVQQITSAIHQQTDPTKRQHLVDFLKTYYGVNFQAPTASDINPANDLTRSYLKKGT